MSSDDAILRQAAADLEAQREAAGEHARAPQQVRVIGSARLLTALATPTQTDEERAAELESAREEDSLRKRRAYIAQRGRRYANCRLSNFVTSGAGSEAKAAARDALQGYLAEWASNYDAGYGVTLYGPVGTGKDHLAAAVCHHAIDCGQRVEWIDGMSLFAELRRSFDRDSRDNETRIIDRYELAPVLCISDPLPVSGELSDFQASALLRIIDGRYNDMRPTITTINVSGGEEAKRRLTPAIYDRIRHMSLAVQCNWESFRRKRGDEP